MVKQNKTTSPDFIHNIDTDLIKTACYTISMVALILTNDITENTLRSITCSLYYVLKMSTENGITETSASFLSTLIDVNKTIRFSVIHLKNGLAIDSLLAPDANSFSWPISIKTTLGLKFDGFSKFHWHSAVCHFLASSIIPWSALSGHAGPLCRGELCLFLVLSLVKVNEKLHEVW